jgi:hypothetical protein
VNPLQKSDGGNAPLAAKFNHVGGSTFGLWPFFLQRDIGKRKEITVTQHVGTLKHQFFHYITITIVLVLFHYLTNFKLNPFVLHFCYLIVTSTGSKFELFQP